MKSPFADFCEDITVGRENESLGEGLRAYRMDGMRDGMRKRAGLGDSLNCCDYLWADDGGFIIIEMTELWETVRNVEQEYSDLEESGRKKFVRRRILHENCLKAYGAMLVLCRLGQWGEYERRMFRLVVSGDTGGVKAFRHWDPEDQLGEDIRDALLGDPRNQDPPIQGALTGAWLVSEVKVMTADELRNELLERAAAYP